MGFGGAIEELGGTDPLPRLELRADGASFCPVVSVCFSLDDPRRRDRLPGATQLGAPSERFSFREGPAKPPLTFFLSFFLFLANHKCLFWHTKSLGLFSASSNRNFSGRS